MNYRDLQELQTTKRNLQDREINSALIIPIAQNVFTGGMVTLTITIIAWIVSELSGVKFVHGSGFGTMEDYIKFSLMALVFVTINYFITIAQSLASKRKTGYGNVSINAIVAIIFVIGAVATSLTSHAIFWILIALAAGFLWSLILLILRFSSEESLIARFIYSLGRASLSGKIGGLEQTNQRLLNEIEKLGGKTDEFYGTDSYSKRKKIINDALTIYDYAAMDERGAPSKRTAIAELNIPQERWSKARDALRGIEAIDGVGLILNRDRGDVENKLAVWLQKHVN